MSAVGACSCCSKDCCIRCLRSEFHYSRICCCHPDWKAFTYSPWLPQKWQVQWLFLVYRWVLGLYFLGWLITASIESSQTPKFLIFLTNWSLILWTLYLLWAALAATFKYFKANFYDHTRITQATESSCVVELKSFTAKPTGCCGAKGNGIAWYHQVHWALFNIGAEAAFIVLILYWSFIYAGQSIDGVNANTHVVNGLVSIIDMLVTGTPIRFLHIYFLPAYGATYVAFSGFYYAANGTNVGGDQPYIYSVLDYGGSPGGAVGIIVGVVFILAPIVHLLFYAMYWIRTGLLELFWRYVCCNRGMTHDHLSENEVKEDTDTAVEKDDEV